VPTEEDLLIARRALGHHLRDARTAAALTLPDAAARAGVAQGYLSDCERGKKLPSLVKLVDLADTYGVLVTDLLNGAYPFGSRRRPRVVPAPVTDGRAGPRRPRAKPGPV
jgi:transcriptional regulator with XRE-family HTH domain